jgi:glycosyltransferase involved in cell wall biosynthesis
LKIALDATYSLDRDPSGVGVYSRELLSGLAAAHPEARFAFCYRPHRLVQAWRTPVPANARRWLLADHWTPRSAVFHGLNQRLPKARLRRSVATFHDLFVMTGEYSTPEFRRRFARQAREAAARADHIIAVSHFTARQVTDLLDVEPGRITVVHHGVRGIRSADRAAEQRERVILHVGALQRRKNIERLVDAFAKVDRDWQLVLAGGYGYDAERILAKITEAPCRDRIRVLGYVARAELEHWYRRAAILAFPSLDEGFGMPVLEAMAAGLPVIASNRSAIPEVAGDAAWLIDPGDTAELADALVELSRNGERRAQLARKGLQHVTKFSWEKAVGETWQVYADLTGRGPSGR